MIGHPHLVLVVPCYNEAARLAVDEFEAFARARADVALVLVDDGSTDGTAAVLDLIRAGCPERVDVLSLGRNLGKAEAVRRGMLAAIGKRPVLAGYWDADLAAPLSALEDFVRLADLAPHVTVLMGARVRLMGRHIERSPLRHYLGRVFATAASWVLGMAVYDTQCGAKVFRVSDDLRRVFEVPFLTRWTFDVEVLARHMALSGRAAADRERLGIYEVALREWRHRAGSKLTPVGALRAASDLLRIWRHYR